MGDYVNSQTAKFDKSFVSCGVVEIHHLPSKTPQQTMYGLANHLYHKANPRPGAYAIFSDVCLVPEGNGRGEHLAAFIKAHPEFGDFWESSRQPNPRTGNIIKLWVLTVNHEGLRKWYAEETMHRIQE